mmetsp:Transcript_70937/g.132681  ORF Transcript_70937/g.132681 Transcript_70937/m.132681 type:complete len:282 (+) Transcript_70937:411-1256(+)
MNTGSSKYVYGDVLEEKTMSLTAGLEPRKICTTAAANAAASNLLTVLSDSSPGGGFTTSTAKNNPAIGALKPAETPAAHPDASRPNCCSLRTGSSLASLAPNLPKYAATFAPSSTDGPSGPKELPVPSDTAAKTARVRARPALSTLSMMGSSTSTAQASSASSCTETTADSAVTRERKVGNPVPSSPAVPPANASTPQVTNPPSAGAQAVPSPVLPANVKSNSWISWMATFRTATPKPVKMPTSTALNMKLSFLLRLSTSFHVARSLVHASLLVDRQHRAL